MQSDTPNSVHIHFLVQLCGRSQNHAVGHSSMMLPETSLLIAIWSHSHHSLGVWYQLGHPESTPSLLLVILPILCSICLVSFRAAGKGVPPTSSKHLFTEATASNRSIYGSFVGEPHCVGDSVRVSRSGSLASFFLQELHILEPMQISALLHIHSETGWRVFFLELQLWLAGRLNGFQQKSAMSS